MMKKRWLMLIILLGVAISGCTKEHNDSITKQTPPPMETDIAQLQSQIEQLQTKLRASEHKYAALENEVAPLLMSSLDYTLYPELAFLSNNPVFQKIEIRDDQGHAFVINDSAILSSVSGLFAGLKAVDTGSPPVGDIEPVDMYVTTDQGTVHTRIIKRDLISFDKLYYGQYFAVDTDIYQLAKAFMNRPLYVPEDQPTMMKMIDSGLMKIDKASYVRHPGRIFHMGKMFFHIKKEMIQKPADSLTAELALTFYYYGEEIQLNLYASQVQLIDGKIETWYEINPDDAEQMKASLTAG